MAASVLPPFLRPIDVVPAEPTSERSYVEATFRHSVVRSTAFAHWYPHPGNQDSAPEIVVLFIPGNPGLLELYAPFLTRLHAKAARAGRAVAILAHAHLGHTPALGAPAVDFARAGYREQLLSHTEALDVLASHFGAGTRYMLLGHSAGTWLSVQILKARPHLVSRIMLVCPTIAHLAKTTGGRAYGWLASPPFSQLITWSSYLLRLLPLPLVSRVLADWPAPQIRTLMTLVRSPTHIAAALRMLQDELRDIAELDADVLRAHRADVCLYFSPTDAWVAEREAMLACLDRPPDGIQIVDGADDVPHDFCIRHGEDVAEHCYQWL